MTEEGWYDGTMRKGQLSKKIVRGKKRIVFNLDEWFQVGQRMGMQSSQSAW